MTTVSSPALELRNITKTFGPVVANENISLILNQGEMLALLGENGAGKTTLMNILFGHYVATSGEIKVFGKPLPKGSPRAALKAGVGMVHQHFTLAENMSALDNVLLGTESLFRLRHNIRAAKRKLAQLSEQFALQVNWSARIKDLSIGQRQRVEILKALYRDTQILILDEPTAVLTPQESDNLFTTLNLLTNKGLSVIFITHKLKEAVSGSHRCIVLRHGKVVMETQASETTPAALAQAMVGGTLPKPPEKKQQTERSLLLTCSAVSTQTKDKSFLLDTIDLQLRAGEILGIAGVSGNGQVALADMLSGLHPPDTGDITLADNVISHHSPRQMVESGVGRIPEDRTGTGVIGDMTVQENLALELYHKSHLSRFGVLNFTALKQHALDQIDHFDIRCPSAEIQTRKLSGGNIQKLILARVLSQKPAIILASQPTWGLDVGAASFVHEQLVHAKEQGAGIIVISEDLDELMLLADRIQVLYKGRISQPVPSQTVDAATLGLAMSGQLDIFQEQKPAN